MLYAVFSAARSDRTGSVVLALTERQSVFVLEQTTTVLIRKLQPHEAALRQAQGRPVRPAELRDRTETVTESLGEYRDAGWAVSALLVRAREAWQSGAVLPLAFRGRVPVRAFCIGVSGTPFAGHLSRDPRLGADTWQDSVYCWHRAKDRQYLPLDLRNRP